MGIAESCSIVLDEPAPLSVLLEASANVAETDNPDGLEPACEPSKELRGNALLGLSIGEETVGWALGPPNKLANDLLGIVAAFGFGGEDGLEFVCCLGICSSNCWATCIDGRSLLLGSIPSWLALTVLSILESTEFLGASPFKSTPGTAL